jgi:hypothetical protein
MSEELNLAESIKVISGSPSAQELAAVIAILEATHAEQAAEKKLAKRPASSWNRNAGNLRGNLLPGFGQWRAQYRPGMD